jgi:hypothetical protein
LAHLSSQTDLKNLDDMNQGVRDIYVMEVGICEPKGASKLKSEHISKAFGQERRGATVDTLIAELLHLR